MVSLPCNYTCTYFDKRKFSFNNNETQLKNDTSSNKHNLKFHKRSSVYAAGTIFNFCVLKETSRIIKFKKEIKKL